MFLIVELLVIIFHLDYDQKLETSIEKPDQIKLIWAFILKF